MPFMDSLRFIRVIRDDGDLLTARPEHVLEGHVFVGLAKQFQTGTIPVLATMPNVTIAAGESYNVLFGYNPNQYTITADTLANQTPGDAIAENILINKIAWVNGTKITGSMPDNGDVNITLDAGEMYTVPLGYHNGQGVVKATSLADQTSGTALDEDILLGKTAWVGGVKLTGAMPNIGDVTVLLDAGKEYKIPLGYHNGQGVVRAQGLAAQTDGTATPKDIVIGKTAWVNGTKITGEAPEYSTGTYQLPLNGTYMIPYGFHSGSEIVTQNIPVVDNLTITPGFEDQIIDIGGKYMENDITVTGIDAYNFNNFDNDLPASISETVVLRAKDNDINNLNRLIGNIPTDNWHDQITSNVYRIDVMYEGPSNGGVPGQIYDEFGGIVFVNNLNQNAKESNIFTIINPIFGKNSESLMVECVTDEQTNSHTFYLKGNMSGNSDVLFGDCTYTIKVSEILQLRKYGDDHDTKEIDPEPYYTK